jgi:hypothetical protein
MLVVRAVRERTRTVLAYSEEAATSSITLKAKELSRETGSPRDQEGELLLIRLESLTCQIDLCCANTNEFDQRAGK